MIKLITSLKKVLWPKFVFLSYKRETAAAAAATAD